MPRHEVDHIEPDGLYEESRLEAPLSGAFHHLIKARLAKQIRFTELGGSRFYAGIDVINWLGRFVIEPVKRPAAMVMTQASGSLDDESGGDLAP